MEYSIKLHGDPLEKQAAQFIYQYLPNYENIWKKYIGNIGNNTMAKITNYEFDKRRQDFWELCYTILESAYINYNTVKSGVFLNPILSFEEYQNFNKNFISFFAHLGRLNDNLYHASKLLGNEVNENELNKYYEARNTIIHGKTIPISYDNLGLIQIPILFTSGSTSFGWTVRSKNWNEGQQIEKKYVDETCEELINGTLRITNKILGNNYDIICNELKEYNASIIFEYDNSYNTSLNGKSGSNGMSGSSGASGLKEKSNNTTSLVSVNVYNIQFQPSQSKDDSQE